MSEVLSLGGQRGKVEYDARILGGGDFRGGGAEGKEGSSCDGKGGLGSANHPGDVQGGGGTGKGDEGVRAGAEGFAGAG